MAPVRLGQWLRRWQLGGARDGYLTAYQRQIAVALLVDEVPVDAQTARDYTQ